MAPPGALLFSQRVQLPFLRIGATTTFGVMYNRKCIPFYWSLTPSTQRRKVLDEHMYNQFQARLAQGNILWWNANSNTLVAKKAVRTWLSRRLRVAMRSALRSRGLDEQGKAAQPGVKSISGTLQLHALRPLLLAKMTDVQREAETVIDIIRARSGAKSAA